MSKDLVEAYFKKIGRTDLAIKEFPVSSATVELAAQAVGVEPGRIAKSLAFKLKDGAVVIVLSGTARLSNRKFKDYFGCRGKMLKPEETEVITGHAVGGVCPFGLKDGVKVYLDNSLQAYDIVYPAAGASNNAVEIKVSEFADITQGEWADLSE